MYVVNESFKETMTVYGCVGHMKASFFRADQLDSSPNNYLNNQLYSALMNSASRFLSYSNLITSYLVLLHGWKILGVNSHNIAYKLVCTTLPLRERFHLELGGSPVQKHSAVLDS